MKRSLVGALFMVLALAGCSAGRRMVHQEPGIEAVEQAVSLRRIAVLPPINRSTKPYAGLVIGTSISQALVGSRFQVVPARESLYRLQTRNAFADYQRLFERPSTVLYARLGTVLDADALLLPTVYEFEQVTEPLQSSPLDEMRPGKAMTVVTLEAQLYEAATGRLLWSQARRRIEIAGTGRHFPDDTMVGREVALALVEPLKRLPKRPRTEN